MARSSLHVISMFQTSRSKRIYLREPTQWSSLHSALASTPMAASMCDSRKMCPHCGKALHRNSWRRHITACHDPFHAVLIDKNNPATVVALNISGRSDGELAACCKCPKQFQYIARLLSHLNNDQGLIPTHSDGFVYEDRT